MNVLDVIFIAMIAIAIVPLAHFVYRYHRYSPWRSTAIGRTVMYQKIALIAILGLSITTRIAGDYLLRPWLTGAVFLSLIFLFWRTDVQLLQTQNEFGISDNWKAYWENRRKKKR